MQPAVDPADFLARPFGRYLIRSNWLSFCASEPVSGFVVWGSPSAVEAKGLTEVIAVRNSRLASPMARWVDLRRLEPNPSAFSVFAEYFAANAEPLERSVTRAAVLHAGGLVQAMVGGIRDVLPAPYPIAAFTEPRAAVSWLGLVGQPSFVREVDDLQASATGRISLLRELRAWLTSRFRDATLPDAAEALGMSPRSLQRHLCEENTSFRREASAQRINAAKRLLRETDLQVKAIASEVGCVSPRHFDELFRKETGTSPTGWRLEHRSRR